jgi:hypothetical protein
LEDATETVERSARPSRNTTTEAGGDLMQQHPSEPQPSQQLHGQTPGTDHVRSEDSNLTVILGEWGFKVLFGFFGVMATLLSMLAPSRRERS